MKLLVTGANGFVGKNFIIHLNEMSDVDVVTFTRDNSISELPSLVSDVDGIIHLAGINRPQHDDEFKQGNADLTQALAAAVFNVVQSQKRLSPLFTARPYRQSATTHTVKVKKQQKIFYLSYLTLPKTQFIFTD